MYNIHIKVFYQNDNEIYDDFFVRAKDFSYSIEKSCIIIVDRLGVYYSFSFDDVVSCFVTEVFNA